jgi:hypothetical protein
MLLVKQNIKAELPRVQPQPAVTKTYDLAGPEGRQGFKRYWKDLKVGALSSSLVQLWS